MSWALYYSSCTSTPVNPTGLQLAYICNTHKLHHYTLAPYKRRLVLEVEAASPAATCTPRSRGGVIARREGVDDSRGSSASTSTVPPTAPWFSKTVDAIVDAISRVRSSRVLRRATAQQKSHRAGHNRGATLRPL